MNNRSGRLLVLLSASGVLCSGGCVRRVVEITSEPSGALVWMNDREVGVTPCEVEILHYGEYDLRVNRDGWEPVVAGRSANPPIWDLPGPDLIAELLPFEVESRAVWHVVLEPENLDADAVMARAEAMRDRLAAIEATDPDPAGTDTPAGLAAEVEESDGSRPDPEAIGVPIEGPIGPVPGSADDPA
jgi:hypothetical protein